MKIRLIALCFLLMSGGIFAQTKKTVAKKSAATTKVVTKTPLKVAEKTAVKKPIVPSAESDGIFAQMETAKGKIYLRLEYQKVPLTVASFISLAEGTNPYVTIAERKGKPFFDGLKFHRVIPDFMIQGGDPMGNGSGSPGYKYKDEETTDVFDKPGVLAMANSGPATNGSQFFITHKETPWLNHKHTIFGHVITGQDVVNAIRQDDVINKVTIIRKGAAANAFNAVKVFTDYYGGKADEEKKQADLEAQARKKQEEEAALAKKAYRDQYSSVFAAKVAELNALKVKSTKTESGLQYILTKGTGTKPADGTNVFVHYSGYFEDGSLFQSSHADVSKRYGMYEEAAAANYQPFPFSYGAKQGLIPGFLEVLNLMSFGDKVTVFIPAKLGYGPRGYGGAIPPNTNLIFEIELLEKQN
ncbi:MAG: peptidylprolyl isomerase [Flavobacterium sp. BFFFF1]|uniref:peptidylprolyl isomerase n=1 Tax=unclassified Flavobacterium TaxID=196869 RepID=UPI000BCA9F72|nr:MULTISPECIES: peptidylprolyl isomerase [unclassified Flavobacterium]OYU80132.1 MAG: peptidylprolyl isomerase [Flavobacterium sp. BFFFF1]